MEAASGPGTITRPAGTCNGCGHPDSEHSFIGLVRAGCNTRAADGTRCGCAAGDSAVDRWLAQPCGACAHAREAHPPRTVGAGAKMHPCTIITEIHYDAGGGETVRRVDSCRCMEYAEPGQAWTANGGHPAGW